MTGLSDVPGLYDLWSTTTGREPRAAARPVPLRPLLDTLGLGVEQVMTHLGEAKPEWDDFLSWAERVVGRVDEPAIARYRAWYDGTEPPAAERSRQAAIMAMDPVFSDAEIARWNRDGVVVLRQAVERHEAAAIEAHLWRVMGATPDDPATWYPARGNGIMVQQFQHPAMDVPRRSARLHRAFAQLYGHADLLASTDRLSFNPPVTARYAFPGPHLHWDTSLADPIPFETGGILYLTDTEAAQGALRVVPGFHHRLAEGWLASLGDGDPRAVDLDAQAVPIAAGAGDLVIWRQDLPHGAGANRTTTPRMAQYVTLYPMHWPDARRWI